MSKVRRTSRFITIILCLVLTVMALASCSAGSEKKDSTSEDETQAPETTTVRLALFEHGHILNMIAEKQGFLAEEGITVEYVRCQTDDEVFEGLANGTIDIASNSGTNLPLQHISEGQELTIFAGYLLTGCMPIFTRVDTEWNSFLDLLGKTMACEPNMYAISGPLLDKGYDPLQQITWLQLEDQNDRIKAVKEGKADFGLVGTHLNYAINSDPELKVCTYASDILPNYSCCRVEANTEWINENPNTVKALLRAWIRAMEYYESHHDETVALMGEITGKDEAFLRAYMDNPHCNLNVDPMTSSVLRAWKYMDRLGLLSKQAKEIDIQDHINTDLYKQALDDCQAKYGSEDSKFYEKMQSMYSKYNILQME